MADDAPSPASSRSAANSKSPAAEGATDATVTQKEDKKQGVKARDNAGDENASGEEGGDDSKKKDGDDEEGGDEKEGDDDPAADDADKKSTQKKAAATPRKPTKRKSSGNLKGSGSSSGTPSAASKKVVREYKAEDLVLHKLKGYPPWPAVILSDEVAELKPDLVKTKPSGSSNKKGKSRNSIGGDGVTARTSYPVAYLHNFFE